MNLDPRLFINTDMMMLMQWDYAGGREANGALNDYPPPANVIIAASTVAAGVARVAHLIQDQRFRAAWYPLLIPSPPMPELAGRTVSINYK